MDAQSELDNAIKAMNMAGKNVMRLPIPRDLDAAWRSVAMSYSEQFVTANYSALQDAFNNGLKS